MTKVIGDFTYGGDITYEGEVTHEDNVYLESGVHFQGGDITTVDTLDWDLKDNDASALSFDTTGKAGILEIDTTNGAEGVKMSGALNITGPYLWINGTSALYLGSTPAAMAEIYHDGADLVINPDFLGSGKIVLAGTTDIGPMVSSGDLAWTLVDNNASALSFDTAGKAGILEIDTLDGAEGVKMSGYLALGGNTKLTAPANGNLLLTNGAGNDFGLLQLGGITSAYPALARSSTYVYFKRADNSDYAGIRAEDVWAQSAVVLIDAAAAYSWSGKTKLTAPADGNLLAANAAGDDFGMLIFGQAGAGYPALKRVGTALHVRLADDSALAGLQAASLTLAGDSICVVTSQSPASDGAGVQGEIAWDADFLYVCTAANTWKKAALTGGY